MPSQAQSSGKAQGAQHDTPPSEDFAAGVDSAGAQRAPSRWQWLLIAAAVIGYAALSYYSDSVTGAADLATGLSYGPLVLIGMALAWRWTRPAIAILIVALTCILLGRYWTFLRSHYQWSNLAQQAGAYGLVAIGFARSLSGPAPPLCTQLADKLHGPLSPEEVAYTRRATVAWAVFYSSLSLTIVILFFVTSPVVWSLFVNFATFALIGLVFVVDHWIRFRVLQRGRRAGGTLAALRQFLIG
jgi:uncharacterized membrane protein